MGDKMKPVKNLLLLLILIFVSFSAFSATKTFTYSGQSFEEIILEATQTETKYNQVPYEGTCSQQVPYQSEVCGYKTHYKTECYTKPGHQKCHTENKTTCRWVTVNEQQCHQGPSKQVCTTKPGYQKCRIVNGRKICKWVPKKTTCKTKPGKQICQNVQKQKKVCTTSPKQVCNWIPSKQICNQQPYQKYECNYVTKYNTEYYSCTKYNSVPYTVVTKKHNANVKVEFDPSDINTNVDFRFTLDDRGRLAAKASNTQVLVLADITKNQEAHGIEMQYDYTYNVRFENRKELMSPIQSSISDMNFNRDRLDFKIGKVYSPEKLRIILKIRTKKNGDVINRELNADEYTINNSGSRSKVRVDLRDLDLKWRFHYVTIRVESIINGTILNSDISKKHTEITKKDFAQ
jgi:hypothetical protein